MTLLNKRDFDLIVDSVRKDYSSQSYVINEFCIYQNTRNDFITHIINSLNIEDIDDNRITINQYLPIAFQAIVKDVSFKEAVLEYDYPNNLPNLSKDLTDKVFIKPEGVYFFDYDETAELPFSLKQNGDTFRMSSRLVVINEQQVIKMD